VKTLFSSSKISLNTSVLGAWSSLLPLNNKPISKVSLITEDNSINYLSVSTQPSNFPTCEPYCFKVPLLFAVDGDLDIVSIESWFIFQFYWDTHFQLH
jgi:hypothetical protein